MAVHVLRLSLLFLFLKNPIHPEPAVFTQLGAAFRANVNDVLKAIQYKGYPHATVTSGKVKK